MRRKSASFIASAAIILSAISIFTFGSKPAQGASKWHENYFPNVTLTTQDGKQVKFYDDLLKGKIVVIDMIFTQCVDACPLETARLLQVQKMLGDRVGKDIFFYSISIDPEHDTPKVLKEYAQKYHVGPGWTFLTGKKEDIALINQKLGFENGVSDPDSRDGHSPSVMIGDEPRGQWIRNSATDNPRFMTNLIQGWLDNWKSVQEANLAKGESTNIGTVQAEHVQMDRGRYIFGSQCAACHTIGHGDKIGPDLQGVTNVRDHEWLVRFITAPENMVKGQDPIASALYKKYNQVNMPNLHLVDDDMAQLLNFLQRQSADADKQNSGTEKTGAAKTDTGVTTAAAGKSLP